MTLATVEQHVRGFFSERQEYLKEKYPGLKVERILNELETLAPKLGMDRRDLLQTPYSPSKNSFLNEFLTKLEEGIPLEYILGIAYFYRSEFVVDSSVLIPRSETEILVELSVQELKRWRSEKDANLKVAEVGTGSGAIALSILREFHAPIDFIATDISKDALNIAEINKYRLGYAISSQSRLRFVEADRLKDIERGQHLIISNPPYIKASESSNNVHKQVNQYEPHLALYLEDDVYSTWFNEFFKQVQESLVDGGLFLMEGHEDHLEELSKMAGQMNFTEVTLIQDYTQRTRFLSARK